MFRPFIIFSIMHVSEFLPVQCLSALLDMNYVGSTNHLMVLSVFIQRLSLSHLSFLSILCLSVLLNRLSTLNLQIFSWSLASSFSLENCFLGVKNREANLRVFTYFCVASNSSGRDLNSSPGTACKHPFKANFKGTTRNL